MTALLGEIQNESIQLFRDAGRAAGGGDGMIVARIEGLGDDGSVLLRAGQKVYRLCLDGVRPGNLRCGSRVLVRETDLSGLQARPPPPGGHTVAGRLPAAAALAKAWRGPWGKLQLGQELQKLFSQEKGSLPAGIRKAVVNLDCRDAAGNLRDFVRDSGLFYEAKVARMALGDGKVDAAIDESGEDVVPRSAGRQPIRLQEDAVFVIGMGDAIGRRGLAQDP